MFDIVQRVLTWLLTLEVVGLIASGLIQLGLPAQIAPVIVIVALLAIIFKVSGDRYMLQRWKRKISNWRNRNR